jgi:hypothetical protein
VNDAKRIPVQIHGTSARIHGRVCKYFMNYQKSTTLSSTVYYGFFRDLFPAFIVPDTYLNILLDICQVAKHNVHYE